MKRRDSLILAKNDELTIPYEKSEIDAHAEIKKEINSLLNYQCDAVAASKIKLYLGVIYFFVLSFFFIKLFF